MMAQNDPGQERESGYLANTPIMQGLLEHGGRNAPIRKEGNQGLDRDAPLPSPGNETTGKGWKLGRSLDLAQWQYRRRARACWICMPFGSWYG